MSSHTPTPPHKGEGNAVLEIPTKTLPLMRRAIWHSIPAQHSDGTPLPLVGRGWGG